MDDLAALRPTIFCSVPRLYNRIYDGYECCNWHLNNCSSLFFISHFPFALPRITNAVKTSGTLKERLFNAAYNSKKQAIMSGGSNDTSPIFAFLFVFLLCVSVAEEDQGLFFSCNIQKMCWFETLIKPNSCIGASYYCD